MDSFYANFLDDIKSILPTQQFLFEERSEMAQEQTLEVQKEDILTILKYLKETRGFNFMMDICGVDWPDRAKRFDVVYHLLNSSQKKRLRVKVQVGEKESIPSATPLWKTANWFEREAFDMYGIQFKNHPDLRRLLTHHEFEGHPLRKDYPADLNQSMRGEPVENTFEKDRQRIMKKYTDEDLMWINIGPAHPATHGTLRFMSVIDGGERIIEMDTEIGYLHRCFEKMCEEKGEIIQAQLNNYQIYRKINLYSMK